jgi:Aspartyl protease/PDZ domain
MSPISVRLIAARRRLLHLSPILILAAPTGCWESTPVVIPFEISNNLILVPTQINGSTPKLFILDSGAESSVVDDSVAKELGLRLESGPNAETGGGSVEASTIKDVSLGIPGLSLPHLTVAGIDLVGVRSGLGEAVAGILGRDLFTRYVVEIDYDSKKLRLHEPARFSYSGTGDTVRLVIDETPFIRGQVSGPNSSAEGQFEFDIGHTGSLTLTGPFAATNRLFPENQPFLSITTGAIAAGRVNVRVGRVSTLKLGRFVLHGPVANIAQGPQDAGIDDEKGGIIGGDVLRRFRMFVDFTRNQVILDSTRAFTEPFEFDMSGMSLAAFGPELRTYRVRTLVEGSPAFVAGIQIGDTVTSIDGRPTAEMTLSQVRSLLRQEGKNYPVIVNGGKARRVTLSTRRLI